MEKIGGVSVAELEEMGMSTTYIEYIRDTAFTFRQEITRSGTVATSYGPAFVMEAFEQGIALGIAEAMRLSGVPRKIGLYWPTITATCAPGGGPSLQEKLRESD